MEPDAPIEYIEARRVLLDALHGLRGQLDAVVLVGAQAVYLRTIGRMPTYQPYTTDADLVIDPAHLGDRPPLGELMTAAGFELSREPGVWHAVVRRPGIDDDIVVPVDLIVPMDVAAGSGRRAARLGGDHGKATARKSDGLEGALVDNGPILIAALESSDPRSVVVNVAGEAALLVAKLHKLGERAARAPDRLEAKDAGDVYRILDVIDTRDMAERLASLLSDSRSERATRTGLGYGDQLFRTPNSPGVRLGVEALRTTLPEPTVRAVFTTYWTALRAELAATP